MKVYVIISLLVLVTWVESHPSNFRYKRQQWLQQLGFDQDEENPSPSTTTTAASPTFRNCVARCPSLPHYNPVCGSNRVTYDNRGKLDCARNCGLDVQFAVQGACS